MSYDLHVYSLNGQIVDRAQIIEKMREKGWDVLLITDWDTLAVSSSGEVNEETVLGWRLNTDLSEKIRELVAHQDKVGIDELYNKGLVGSCEIYLSRCRSEEDVNELYDANETRTDYLDAMRNARTAYWLMVNMGKSQKSYELLEALWYALGEISEGLLEDLQLDYLFFSYEKPPTPVSTRTSSQMHTIIGYIIGFAIMAVLVWILQR